MLDAIVSTLEGHETSDGWLLCCPAHNDSNPSLSVKDAGDGRALVHCFGGCSQTAVIDALKASGLWWLQRSSTALPAPPKRVPKASNKSAIARFIWNSAEDAKGTPVETYLRSRGINIPIPSTIRYHRALSHPLGSTYPAMVALVTDASDSPVAIHRTWLAHDGTAKAPVRNSKMMLGPCAGGSVRLSAGTSPLMIGEGLETCLTIVQERNASVWAALSTSGLRALELPHGISTIVVLADGDDAGESAAVAVANRLIKTRLSVSIARAPRGTDFNDILLQEGTSK